MSENNRGKNSVSELSVPKITTSSSNHHINFSEGSMISRLDNISLKNKILDNSNEQEYVDNENVIPNNEGTNKRKFSRSSEIVLKETTQDSPETKDSECQTRESLFSIQITDSNSDRSIPSSLANVDHRMTPNQVNVDQLLPFTTFGYSKSQRQPLNLRASGSVQSSIITKDGENQLIKSPTKRIDTNQYSTNTNTTEQSTKKRYKAEAVIEMDNKKKEQEINSSASGSSTNPPRPFSIDSTKSAPDVIVTH